MSKEDNSARRDNLKREIGLMEVALKGGAITKAQYLEACEFLYREVAAIDRNDKGSVLGFDEISRAVQSLAREEIISRYGMDLSVVMNRYASFAVSPAMPNNMIGMISRRSGLDYERQVTGQWSDESVLVYASGVSVDYEDVVGTISEEDILGISEKMRELVETEMYKFFTPDASKEITGPVGLNAAGVLWKDYSGVVLCECDDCDCDAVIDISRDEYLHASGHGGYYRVTSSDCSYGVLGAYLVERGDNYRVWTKMA